MTAWPQAFVPAMVEGLAAAAVPAAAGPMAFVARTPALSGLSKREALKNVGR